MLTRPTVERVLVGGKLQLKGYTPICTICEDVQKAFLHIHVPQVAAGFAL